MRWGVLGPGLIATHRFMPALRQVAGSEVVAVCGPVREETDRFAAQFGVPRRYYHLEEFVADAGPELVYVASPNLTHAENTIACLEAGKHVLCEKPMAPTLAECDRMIAAAERAGRVLAIGHLMRFFGYVAVARQLIASGRIGRPLLAHAEFGYSLPDFSPQPFSTNQFRLQRSQAGGVAFDLGVHAFDSLRAVLGAEVVEVAALASNAPFGSDTDEVAAISARFDNGVLATVGLSCNSRHSRRDLMVAGETGVLVAEPALWRDDEAVLRLRTDAGWQEIAVEYVEGYVAEIQAIERAAGPQ